MSHTRIILLKENLLSSFLSKFKCVANIFKTLNICSGSILSKSSIINTLSLSKALILFDKSSVIMLSSYIEPSVAEVFFKYSIKSFFSSICKFSLCNCAF